MKHSELPFKFYGLDDAGWADIFSSDNDGFPLLRHKNQKEDAQFIVKACNNHYKLLEALRELSEAEWMVTHDWGGDRGAIMKKAEQAIKEAE